MSLTATILLLFGLSLSTNVSSALKISPVFDRRAVLATVPSVFAGAALGSVAHADPGAATSPEGEVKFRRVPRTQFIAALGDPNASSGRGADQWGLWTEDPGPRGVRLGSGYKRMMENGGEAPAGWTFDPTDWWLEEHGLIMEAPGVPLPARRLTTTAAGKVVVGTRRYVVTGGRAVTTVLTVHDDGAWELAEGKLYDVTHLPCRSARYTTLAAAKSKATPGAAAACTPERADRKQFPVKPGAVMPSVPGCEKQDYAVLFVLAVES